MISFFGWAGGGGSIITHDHCCGAAVCDNADGERLEMGAGFLCDAHFSIISFECPWCLALQYNSQDGSVILCAFTRLRVL